MHIAVIMAGGRGERFWPKSRRSNPKQLLDIFTGRPLLVDTVNRLSGLIPINQIFLITDQAIAERIHWAIPNIPKENIIAEPMGKNTAAAIGVISTYLKFRFGNPTIAVLSADHLIPNKKKYQRYLKMAFKLAEKYQSLITFGIKPTYPETGYGYIKSGKLIKTLGAIRLFKVDKFYEKPNLNKAKGFIKNSTYSWNSGMFCWTCDTILMAINKYMPKLSYSLNQIELAIKQNQFPSILNKIYPDFDNIPIDKGVMEKADNAMIIPVDFEWSDIGSWITFNKIHKSDNSGNIRLGEIINLDTKNSILITEKPLIATMGIKDLIIVAMDDVVLVCSKNKAQDIKKIVQYLEQSPKTKKYL